MSKRILVADDQPGIRLLLEEVLIGVGYFVKTAGTGQETIDCLHQKEIDLLLLDYYLPVRNGEEVLQWMSQKKISTPVVMMSGQVSKERRRTLDYPNLREIIAKPFDIPDMCQVVNRCLMPEC